MTKSERLELIKSIYYNIGHKSAPGLMGVSDSEVEQTAKEEFFPMKKIDVEDENVVDLSVTSFKFSSHES